MPFEIERKFLVNNLNFKTECFKSERIKQGYLSTDPQRSVRVRVKGDEAFITVKGESDRSGLMRFEWEKEISVADAELLLELCDELTLIDKTRYYIKNGESLLWEVDEFYGLNEGLIIAEIELHHKEEHFDNPKWVGKEVTGQIKYYNSQLSQYPYSKWETTE